MSPVPAAFGTAQQHALDWLRQLIIAGELRPGGRVNQEELSEKIGLSVAPVREALRVLEQEGQVTYLPRRGYFVTELRIADLREIYALREILEERAVRAALPAFDEESLERLRRAAADCVEAVDTADVASELAANRRFHFALFDAVAQPHTLRLIRLLWESTEAYRAMYYNSPDERLAAIGAHDRILEAAAAGDADRLVIELNEHRQRALDVLGTILIP
jgi:DNA-binding GntR family transcriptional regulator